MQTNKTTETKRQRFAELKAKLAGERDARSAALLAEYTRCGHDWKDGRYVCQIPGCPDCTRRNSTRQVKEAQYLFGGLRNEDVAFVSVVAGATQCPSEVFQLLKRAKQGTIDRRKSAARTRAAWGDTQMLGWCEVDAVAGYQVPMLAPGRATLLPQLALIPFDSDEPTYIATYHALIYLNGLEIADVRNTFGKQWKLEGQVDVSPLRSYQTITENVGRLAAYSTKFSSVTELTLNRKGHKWIDPWPVKWDASLYSHLYSIPMRNAFEYMRFSIGFCGRELPDEMSSDVFDEGLSLSDPIPFTWSSPREPMYNILCR